MKTKQFRIGPLSTLGEVVTAIGKTIRAMSDGSIDSQVGARICNGLGILRMCIDTQRQLEQPDRAPRLRKIIHEYVHVTEPRELEDEPLVEGSEVFADRGNGHKTH